MNGGDDAWRPFFSGELEAKFARIVDDSRDSFFAAGGLSKSVLYPLLPTYSEAKAMIDARCIVAAEMPS